VIQVRYECLVRDCQGELERLLRAIGGEAKKSLASALGATTIPKLRAMVVGHEQHFWQGRTGLWKSLLTSHEAIEIGRAHSSILETLDYQCDPDPKLDGLSADAHWLQLTWADLADHLHDLSQAKQEISRLKNELAAAQAGQTEVARAELTR